MNLSKFVGCSLIVVGSSIGSGILALPIQFSGAGFYMSMAAILAIWVLMTVTGFLVIEMNLALPPQACSFNSMAERTLGPLGKTITWISYLLLLCSILAAYVAGESSLIVSIINSLFNITMPHWLSAFLFVFVLGSAVFWGTKVVDYFNRGLISFKGFLLIVTLILILPNINLNLLTANQNLGRAKYLFAATPVFLHIFNYHFVVPSLRMYAGDKANVLKWIVICGTTTCLIFYILWTIATLGTVPMVGDNSFASLAQLGRPVDTPDFIRVITAILHNKLVTTTIHGFYNISMTTSFLGVALGLFDFLADGFKRPNTHFGRLQTAVMTFLPPLVFALFYPRGFIMALNYSSSFIAILCIILPALMVYKLRKSTDLKSPYRAMFSSKLLIPLAFFGFLLFLFPILANLHLLPSAV